MPWKSNGREEQRALESAKTRESRVGPSAEIPLFRVRAPTRNANQRSRTKRWIPMSTEDGKRQKIQETRNI